MVEGDDIGLGADLIRRHSMRDALNRKAFGDGEQGEREGKRIKLCPIVSGCWVTRGALQLVVVFVMLSAMAADHGVAMAGDGNSNFNPCVSGPAVQVGDGFSLGFAFAGVDTWPHSSTGGKDDPNSFIYNPNPCDYSDTNPTPLGNVSIAVFRPRVDELSILRFTKEDLNSMSAASANALSFFAKDRLAAPRVWFSAPDIIVPTFTLIVNLDQGRLYSLRWKSESCGICKPCITHFSDYPDPQNSCGVSRGSEQCAAADSTACDLAIQVAWAGTDKNNRVLNSWYEVDILGRYSLSGLYSRSEKKVKDTQGNVGDRLSGLVLY